MLKGIDRSVLENGVQNAQRRDPEGEDIPMKGRYPTEAIGYDPYPYE